jgi:hypothetical protein
MVREDRPEGVEWNNNLLCLFDYSGVTDDLSVTQSEIDIILMIKGKSHRENGVGTSHGFYGLRRSGSKRFYGL